MALRPLFPRIRFGCIGFANQLPIEGRVTLGPPAEVAGFSTRRDGCNGEWQRARISSRPLVSESGVPRRWAVLYLPADRLPAAAGEEVSLAPEGHGPLEDWCIEILGRLICFRDPTSARD